MQDEIFGVRTFFALLAAPLLFCACNTSNGNGLLDGEDAADVLPEGTEEEAQEEAAGPLPFGSHCTANENCIENVCFENTCTRECDSYARCPETGTRCVDEGEGRALCLATTHEEGPGTTGASCAIGGQDDCAEGYFCMSKTADDPYAFCTKECAGDRECPAGMLCKALIEGERTYCRPRGYCDRCLFDDECGYAGDRCIADDAGTRFCSHQCSMEGKTCPVDSSCTDMGEGIFQCMPDYEGHACVGGGELCSPCEADDDCLAGGKCIEDYYTHIKFCGVPCNDPSCPAPDAYYCNEDNQCRPRKGSCTEPSGSGLACDNCEDFTDCLNGYCLGFPDQYHMVCGEDCSDTMTCSSPWAVCYEITDISGATLAYNCLPNENIANCFQYQQCTTYCPDGPSGCDLPFCRL
jgi:hypothetical protein